MPNELRWGIIGCGMISHEFVLAMRKCNFVNTISAVATANDLERARKFASELNLCNSNQGQCAVYGSYNELLHDENIDVVYIAVLNQAHCEWVCNSLRAGKHVLCEKPLCANEQEARRMVDCARESKRFLMEAWWPRCFPAYRALHDVLQSGELGAVKLIGANFGSATLPENRTDTSIAECPLNDIGSYLMQFALFCMGDRRPSKVTIAASTEDGPQGGKVDIGGNIYFEWEGEKGTARACLVYTTEVDTVHSAYVAFENGVCEFPEAFNCPTRFTKIAPVPKGGVPSRETRHWDLEDDLEMYHFQNSSGLRYEIDHVYECLRDNRLESPYMPHSSSILLTQITDELRRQAGISFPSDGDTKKMIHD